MQLPLLSGCWTHNAATRASGISYIQTGFQSPRGQPILWQENDESCGLSQFESPEGPCCWNSPFPPWTSLDELDSVGIGKGEKSEAEIRKRLIRHTSKCHGSDAIYTDGSKSENSVGCAAVSRRNEVGSLSGSR